MPYNGLGGSLTHIHVYSVLPSSLPTGEKQASNPTWRAPTINTVNVPTGSKLPQTNRRGREGKDQNPQVLPSLSQNGF